MAERPVGAAEPGIGGAHDDPDRDQPESGREGQRGELLEAVHEAPFYPGGAFRPTRDTLSAMTPRRLAPAPASRSPSLVMACASSGSSGAVGRRLGRRRTWRLGAAHDRARTLIPVLVTNAIAAGKAGSCSSTSTPTNRVASAPDRTAKVAFYDLDRDPTKAVATVDGAFVWTIENERGMYVVNADLPEAGHVGRRVHDRGTRLAGRDRPADLRRPRVEVPTVQVGQTAPASKTPTAADVGGDLAKISTDTTPDPAFYQTSVADALAAHKPFMLVFATPKFCTSQQCGPTLDQFKPIAAAQPRRHVHQRRAVPAPGRRRVAPAGPRREQPAPGDGRHRRVGPAVRAVDLRGRPERDRPGSYEVTITPAELDGDPAGHHRRRLGRPAPSPGR